MSILRNREIEEMYFSLFFRKLAISIIGIFVPVYLLSAGYSFTEMIIFFIVFQIVWGLMIVPARMMTSRFGMKHTMTIAIPFLILYFVSLLFLGTNPVMFYVAAIFAGFQGALYWIPYNIDFAMVTDKKKRGKEMGFVAFVSLSPSIIGPILGGLLITFFSFDIMFIAGVIIGFMAIIPLFMSSDTKPCPKKGNHSYFQKIYWREALSFSADGVRHVTQWIFWPLAIFTLAGTHLSLGIVGTLEVLFAAFTSIATGFIVDVIRRRRFIHATSVLESASWLLKAFAVLFSSFTQLIGTAMFGGLARGSFDVSIGASIFDKGQKNPVGYFVFIEVAIVIGRLAILFIALAFFADNVIYGLVATAAAALIYGFAQKKL